MFMVYGEDVAYLPDYNEGRFVVTDEGPSGHILLYVVSQGMIPVQ